MSDSKSYNASCHCGSVKLSFTTSPPIEEKEMTSCNCSICHINGYLLTFVDASQISFEDSEGAKKEYRFASRNYPHYFCGNCGTSMYVQRALPGPEQPTAINLRTVEGIDLKGLKIKEFDGKNLQLGGI